MYRVYLEVEQQRLLAILVEASRNVSQHQRQPFLAIQRLGPQPGLTEILHPGLPKSKVDVYRGDIEALASSGLLRATHEGKGVISFDVHANGFAYYEEMKLHVSIPTDRVESELRAYLTASEFRQEYPGAYEKWADAEALLWGSESERQLTTIGHICREALQNFATALVNKHKPPFVDTDAARTVSRIKAVLTMRSADLGNREKPFLEAILTYWGTVNDLVQRQEHGAQKEGRPLVWEDARRVVFHTAIIMFEFGRSLSRF